MAIDVQEREALAVRHKKDPKQITSTQARSLLAAERIPRFVKQLLNIVDKGYDLTERQVRLLDNEYRQFFCGKPPFRCNPQLEAGIHGWSEEDVLSCLYYLKNPENADRHKAHKKLVELCAMSSRD